MLIFVYKKKAGIPGNIGSAVILFLNLNYSFLFCSIYNTESTDTVLLNKIKIYYTRATCTSYVCVCVCVWDKRGDSRPAWSVTRQWPRHTCGSGHWSPGFYLSVVCSASLVYWITQILSPCLFTFSTHTHSDDEPFCPNCFDQYLW